MEAKRFAVSVKTPARAPPEYARAALENARRRAGNELYEILWTYRLPAVVDIEEREVDTPADYWNQRMNFVNELIIQITATPVKYQHIVMPVYDSSLSVLEFKRVQRESLMKRIQRAFSRLTKKGKGQK